MSERLVIFEAKGICMEIRGIETNSGESPLRRPARDQSVAVARPDEPVAKQNESSASREPARATPTQRKPALVQVVSKGLADAGIPVDTATVVTSPEVIQKAQSSKDLESTQSEKVAQALQAFMHSLVQATAVEPGDRANIAGTPAPSVNDPATNSTTGSAAASSAYTGLVSQLESLVRKLESPAIVGESGPVTSELDSAFRDLLVVSGDVRADGSTATSRLQDVLRNIARNLQSTGNPNLATTGNVINTAA